MTIQNLDGKVSLEQHAEIEADLAQRFPEADMKLARAFVRREGIYANAFYHKRKALKESGTPAGEAILELEEKIAGLAPELKKA